MVLYEMYAAKLPFVDNLKGVINIYIILMRWEEITVLKGLVEEHSLIYTRVVFFLIFSNISTQKIKAQDLYQTPFSGDKILEQKQVRLNRLLNDFRKDTPETVQRIFTKCVAVNRENRFTFEEVYVSFFQLDFLDSTFALIHLKKTRKLDPIAGK